MFSLFFLSRRVYSTYRIISFFGDFVKNWKKELCVCVARGERETSVSGFERVRAERERGKKRWRRTRLSSTLDWTRLRSNPKDKYAYWTGCEGHRPLASGVKWLYGIITTPRLPDSPSLSPLTTPNPRWYTIGTTRQNEQQARNRKFRNYKHVATN